MRYMEHICSNFQKTTDQISKLHTPFDRPICNLHFNIFGFKILPEVLEIIRHYPIYI